MAHAWLRRDGWVYDAVLDKSVSAIEYAQRFAAEELATFDYVEAAHAMLSHRHWGPWIEIPPPSRQ